MKETFSKVYKFLWGWAVLDKNAASPTPETEYQREKEGFDKTYKPETINTPLKKILAVFYPLVLILTVVISFSLMVTKPFFTSLEKISWRFWDFVRYTGVMMIVTLPPPALAEVPGFAKDGGKNVRMKDGKEKQLLPMSTTEYSCSNWRWWLNNVTIGAGLQNVTDEDPPFVAGSFENGYDESLATIKGRFWYVQLKKRF
jgi:hypothetical protein